MATSAHNSILKMVYTPRSEGSVYKSCTANSGYIENTPLHRFISEVFFLHTHTSPIIERHRILRLEGISEESQSVSQKSHLIWNCLSEISDQWSLYLCICLNRTVCTQPGSFYGRWTCFQKSSFISSAVFPPRHPPC